MICYRCLKDKPIPKDYKPQYCCPPDRDYDISCGCEQRPINPMICDDCEEEIKKENKTTTIIVNKEKLQYVIKSMLWDAPCPISFQIESCDPDIESKVCPTCMIEWLTKEAKEDLNAQQ